jgi:hypothetical protein
VRGSARDIRISLVSQMVEIGDQAELRVSLNHTGRKMPSAIFGH